MVDDLLDRSSQSFVLAAFRPQDFFSDGGDRHDVQVVVVDRLAHLFRQYTGTPLSETLSRMTSDKKRMAYLAEETARYSLISAA